MKVFERCARIVTLVATFHVVMFSVAYGQIGGGGGAVDNSPPVAAINSGVLHYAYPIQTPVGDVLEYSWNPASGWQFGIQKLVNIAGGMRVEAPGYGIENLYRDTSTTSTVLYQIPSGSFFEKPSGGLMRLLHRDGGFTEFVGVGQNNALEKKVIGPTGWYSEYFYNSNGQLIKVEYDKHPLNGSAAKFIATVERTPTGEVSSVTIRTGDASKVLGQHIFGYRLVNNARTLVAIVFKSSTGSTIGTTAFEYRSFLGLNYLKKISNLPVGNITTINYGQKQLPGTVQTRIVVVSTTTQSPPSPPLETRYSYTGGKIENDHFIGFENITTEVGTRLKTSITYSQNFDQAGQVLSVETSSLVDNRPISLAINNYQQGGVQNKVSKLSEISEQVFAKDNTFRTFRTLYTNDFVRNVITRISRYGEWAPELGAAADSDNTIEEVDFELCSLLHLKCFQPSESRFFGPTSNQSNLRGSIVNLLTPEGRIARTTTLNSDGSSTFISYTYDDYNNPKIVSTSSGSRKENLYDPTGYLLTGVRDLTLGEANTSQTKYNPDTLLVEEEVDRFGTRTLYTRDEEGRVIQTDVINPNGDLAKTFVAGFNLNGATLTGSNNLISSAGTNKPYAGVWLDLAQRALQSYVKEGSVYRTVSSVFNQYGEKTKETYPFSSTEEVFDVNAAVNRPGAVYEYDELGQRTATRYQGGSAVGLVDQVISYGTSLDQYGRTDPASQEITQGPMKKVFASGLNTNIESEGTGDESIMTVTTSDGLRTESRDGDGNFLSREVRNFLGQTVESQDYNYLPKRFEYLSNGNIIREFLGEQMLRRETKYNGANGGRLEYIKYGPPHPQQQSINYQYNAKGQVSHIYGPWNTREIEYDESGRESRIRDAGLDGQSVTCNFAYNKDGTLKSFSAANSSSSNVVINFYRDSLGRIVRIATPNLPPPNATAENNQGSIAIYSYSDPGSATTTATTTATTVQQFRARIEETCFRDTVTNRLKECVRRNFQTGEVLERVLYSHNPADPRLSVEHYKGARGEYTTNILEVNSRGQPTKVQELVNNQTINKEFTYNSLGNLIQEKRTRAEDGVTETHNWGWNTANPYQHDRTTVGQDSFDNYYENGWPTQERTPDGHTRRTTYDNAGLIEQVALFKDTQHFNTNSPYSKISFRMNAADPGQDFQEIHEEYGEKTTRTRFCWDSPIKVEKVTTEIEGVVSSIVMLFHIYGPDPMGLEARLATLTYPQQGPINTHTPANEPAFDPKQNMIYEGTADGLGHPPSGPSTGGGTGGGKEPGSDPGQPDQIPPNPGMDQPATESYPTCGGPFLEANNEKKKKDKENLGGGCFLQNPSSGSQANLTGGSGNSSSCDNDQNDCSHDKIGKCTDPEPEDKNGEPKKKKKRKCGFRSIFVAARDKCVSIAQIARTACSGQYPSQKRARCQNDFSKYLNNFWGTRHTYEMGAEIDGIPVSDQVFAMSMVLGIIFGTDFGNFIPFVNDLKNINDTIMDWENNSWWENACNTVSCGIGLIPAIGDAGQIAGKYGLKSVRELIKTIDEITNGQVDGRLTITSRRSNWLESSALPVPKDPKWHTDLATLEQAITDMGANKFKQKVDGAQEIALQLGNQADIARNMGVRQTTVKKYEWTGPNGTVWHFYQAYDSKGVAVINTPKPKY